MNQKRLKSNLILALSTCILLFILGEITVRIKDTLAGHNFFSNDRDELSYSHNPIMPYVVFGHKLYIKKGNELFISSCHDELYPIKKAPNTFRIICLGGSTTINEDSYLKYKEHYPLLLQNLLQAQYPNKKIEVINLGFGGYSTAHLLILFELNVISWDPDLVIVSENHNDLTAYCFPPELTLDYSNKYGSYNYTGSSYFKNFTTLNTLFRWSSFYWSLKDKWDKIFDKPDLVPISRRSFGNAPPKLSM